MNEEKVAELCDFFHKLKCQPELEKCNHLENTCNEENDGSIEDIRKFDRFLRENGGHNGGWGSFEHSTFMKLQEKKSPEDVVRILKLNFPDITEEDILQHRCWYDKYAELKRKQVTALKNWRHEKQKIDDLNSQRSDTGSTNVVTKITPRTDEGVRQRILKWREERKQMNDKIEEEKEVQGKQKAEENKYWRKEQERRKQVLNEHKRKKETQNLEIKRIVEAEEEERKKLITKQANKMIHIFRKKDIKLTHKRHMKARAKLVRDEERKKVLENIVFKNRKNINVVRDPIRLLVPTVEWRQKMILYPQETRKEERKLLDSHCVVDNIPHLATPEWRKTRN